MFGLISPFYKHETYHHVSGAGGEDTKSLLSGSPSQESEPYADDQRCRTLTPAILTLCIVTGSLLASLVGFFLGRQFPANLDATCTRHVSRYSPITENVAITYNTMKFNGSFYKEDIYRQDPSPEVDAAWEALGTNYRTGILPEALGRKAGLTKDHTRRNKKYGGGYLVLVEGLHHLHCLNLLRKALYYNRDYYHSRGEVEFSDSDWAQRLHVSHCLDIIRQRLMCFPDIGVFGSVWVRNGTHIRPFVDFNTEHMCMNFDQIREWAQERQIAEEVPPDFMEDPELEGREILEEFP